MLKFGQTHPSEIRRAKERRGGTVLVWSIPSQPLWCQDEEERGTVSLHPKKAFTEAFWWDFLSLPSFSPHPPSEYFGSLVCLRYLVSLFRGRWTKRQPNQSREKRRIIGKVFFLSVTKFSLLNIFSWCFFVSFLFVYDTKINSRVKPHLNANDNDEFQFAGNQDLFVFIHFLLHSVSIFCCWLSWLRK